MALEFNYSIDYLCYRWFINKSSWWKRSADV
jgi:hypothetical protein